MTRAEKNKKKKMSRIFSLIGNIIILGFGGLAISAMMYITIVKMKITEALALKILPYGFGLVIIMIVGWLLMSMFVWKYEEYFKLYKNTLLARKEAQYATQFMKHFHNNNLERANFYFDLLKHEHTKSTMIGFIRGTLYGNPDKTKSDEILRGFYEKTYGKN